MSETKLVLRTVRVEIEVRQASRDVAAREVTSLEVTQTSDLTPEDIGHAVGGALLRLLKDRAGLAVEAAYVAVADLSMAREVAAEAALTGAGDPRD